MALGETGLQTAPGQWRTTKGHILVFSGSGESTAGMFEDHAIPGKQQRHNRITARTGLFVTGLV